MRAVIQKVSHAHIAAADSPDAPFSQIPHGLCVLLGVGSEDSEADARYIADKIAHLRIFEDEAGKLNLSVKDTGGEVLLVSQFTLYGDARNGRRPSFSQAARPEQAEALYQQVAALLRGKQFVQQRQHRLGGLRCQTLQHFGSGLGGGVTVFGHGGFFQVACGKRGSSDFNPL